MIRTDLKNEKYKKEKKDRSPLIWILILLILLLGGGAILLILKPWESKIDHALQQKYTELVVHARELEDKGSIKEALEEYKEALELTNDEVITRKIESLKLTLRIKSEYEAWELAQQKNTIASYNVYIESFTEGEHILDAKDAILVLEQGETEQQTRADAIAKRALKEQEAGAELARQEVERQRNEILAEIFDNMVHVSGGTFMMGCPDYYRSPTWNDYESGERWGECGQNENPAHEVTLNSFFISKYEVTQAQWKAVMGNNPSKYAGCFDCPVEMVSWKEVQDFIKTLNQLTGKSYRLPSEAEWEYAARGGDTNNGLKYKYAGSDKIGLVAWYTLNSENKTHLVGQKQPNELGLFDMCGNVSEYCSDWYGRYYYRKSPKHDPKGPSSGTVHVTRGGNGFTGGQFCRVTEREPISPKYNRAAFLGFRLTL